MGNSLKLFKLVKSLSKSEKRYFKLACSVHKGSKNYLDLFDLFDKQNSFEKEVIPGMKKFKRLPHLKKYLYNLILESLQSYHANLSVDMKLGNIMQQAGILFEKGLYEDCLDLLQQAKKIAVKHERFLLLIEIIEWKKKIALRNTDVRALNEDADKLYREKILLLGKQKNLAEYSRYHSMVNVLSRTGKTTRNISLQNFAFMESPLLADTNETRSFPEKIYRYRIYGSFYTATGALLKAYNNHRKWVAMMEAHPTQMAEEINDYIDAVNNLINACSRLKKYDEALENIHKLRTIPGKLPPAKNTTALKAKIFSRSYNMELAYYLNMADFTEGTKLVDTITSGLQDFETKINKKDVLLFYFKILSLYYYAGDLSKALAWLNKILNFPEKDVFPDIHSTAQIINLLLHFDLQNMDLLGYIVKSASRFLSKRNRLYKLEAAILDFLMKKLPKIISQEQLTEAFKELKTEIGIILEGPSERKALEYFDFVSWLESKTENRPFALIVKEKAEARESAGNLKGL